MISVLAVRMTKDVLLVLGLTLAYIFLLTIVFENFVNKPSSTVLSLAALFLFIAASVLYAYFIIKTIKNRLK